MARLGKLIAALALMGLAGFMFTGCSGSYLKGEVADGLYQYVETGHHDEYKAYVTADPNISDETKAIRIETADRLKGLILKIKKKADE